jgi:hypothetical protein
MKTTETIRAAIDTLKVTANEPCACALLGPAHTFACEAGRVAIDGTIDGLKWAIDDPTNCFDGMLTGLRAIQEGRDPGDPGALGRPPTIPEMQEAILAAGWQWVEHVFNGGACGPAAECLLRLTSSKHPLALLGPDRLRPAIGWGRFSRDYCWRMAYRWIIEGIREERKTKGDAT